MTLGEIADVVDGTVVGDADRVVRAPAFSDSREVERDGLFVAIVGARADGHDFAADVVEQGAAGVLSERATDVPGVVVRDPVAALGLLARHVVDRLADCTVVGITGSQGKTSTKDLLTQVLADARPTVATRANANNELGVPLTVLRATKDTRFLVLEMGARGVGHVAELCAIAPPDIGCVLNVGVAHVGEFGSKQAIAQAKGELVEAARQTAVLNADDALVSAMRERARVPVATFGESPDADLRVEGLRLDGHGRPRFTLLWAGGSAEVSLQVVGEHQAANAAAAATVAQAVGLDLDHAAAVLSNATATSRWRMEQHDRADGVTVINDAYNANPDSMRAALRTLATIGAGPPKRRTVAVLGEMLELGGSTRAEHDALGRLVVRLGIDQLVVVGDEARDIHLGASLEGSWDGESVLVPDTETAIDTVASYVRPGDVVLLKASRAVGLERVADALLDADSHTRRGDGDEGMHGA